ncbi:MAG: protein kinase [Myxococcales bacterium]|nr:protein kinase [Myxococcales bacterium]
MSSPTPRPLQKERAPFSSMEPLSWRRPAGLGSSYHPGDRIGGRFEAVCVLEREAGGLALEVVHLGFGQRMVLQVISPALVDGQGVARFQRQARVLASLESEHVARVFDAGVLPDGNLYVLRERVGGDSLWEEAIGRRLATHEALTLLAQIAEPVQEAHARGVVLRGLSPRRIRVKRRRSGEICAKITDMTSCRIHAEAPSRTMTGALELTPFTAPELLGPRPRADERTDVFSLGAILFTLFAGRAPFDGDGQALVAALHSERRPSLLPLRADVPTSVERAIQAALAVRPADRPSDVHALVHELWPDAPPAAQLTMDRIARLSSPSLARASYAGFALDDAKTQRVTRRRVEARPPTSDPAPVVHVSRGRGWLARMRDAFRRG